jgi:hypothetical protein
MTTLATNAARAAFLVLATIATAGCATTGLTPAEKMMWSTYVIASPKGIATGIIVNRKDRSAPDGNVPVLVTSAHVLAVAPRGPFYIAYRSPQQGAAPMVNILELDPPEQGDHFFFQHPRQDVAALEIRLPPELANEVALLSYIEERSISSRRNEPHPGEDVSILGFPSVFPGTEGGFAVLRAGRVASYSAGSPADRETFLINTNVYRGDSGGPVFRTRNGKPRLVGILTERIGRQEGSVPLAVALNASVVAETLRLEAAQEWTRSQRALSLGREGRSDRQSVRLLGPARSLREILASQRRPLRLQKSREPID